MSPTKWLILPTVGAGRPSTAQFPPITISPAL
jgi:hypothetical protein